MFTRLINAAPSRFAAPCLFAFAAALTGFSAVASAADPDADADPRATAFVNFETAPVHPLALSPAGDTLAVCNLADGKLELFDLTSGSPVALASVPVGLDPVSVRFRTASEAWVVNQISDSISVVDIAARRVIATVDTLDTPADVVFAGAPLRAFVSCALPNTLQVIDTDARRVLTNIVINAERPKALAVSADGREVYVAIFESGNRTTLVGPQFKNLLFIDNAASQTNGPYGGLNPPPNAGASFQPPLNPALPTNFPPSATGVIVRKNTAGRWLDDNQRDWTEFISGTNASLTQRVPGWDLPDRDLAIVDTTDLSVRYATGLMNICMALEVNPASGRVTVVGTDAVNEVRFEPNLNGIFVRVKAALVDPRDLGSSVVDLNPQLDYTSATAAPSERERSIGDPRALAWSADGTRAYVAGMGSRNLVLIDAEGHRLSQPPIEVGEGPCGLAWDQTRGRLYVFNRFSSSLSVVDTGAGVVIQALPLFDPTPLTVAAGRRHLYDTRRTSGLGQAACASCHVDARIDRLGWDLGNPAGDLVRALVNNQGLLVTNAYHPMKGVMTTQTLQDIIGHEPFHWRGDRPGLEAFNATFTNLQGAVSALTTNELSEFRDFLASIRFPPNPYRPLDNSLPTNLALVGAIALGRGQLPAGAPLPPGNAVAGLALFNQPVNFCASCHSLPTGLGLDATIIGGAIQPIAAGPNGEHHFPLAFRLEGSLLSKIAQFRNLADKVGMDGTQPQSRAGFGFGHDGSVDSLTRFLNGVRIVADQEVADLTALLLAVSGSDVAPPTPGAPLDPSPPASTGRQLTLNSAARTALFDAFLVLAQSPTSRVDLIAKGTKDGLARGWWYDPGQASFQSDRRKETASPDDLLALAGPGRELTLTIVPRGLGPRLGIDRDQDGLLDRDELDAGSNPADPSARLALLVASPEIPVGTELSMEAQVGPLPAPALGIHWRKDDEVLAGATTALLSISNAPFSASGVYQAAVNTAFGNYTSPPVTIRIVPAVVTVTPAEQAVRLGSNALFTATAGGVGPFEYQWQFNGSELPAAAASALSLANVQLTNEGSYRAVIANTFGTATSAPVRLGVLVNPVLLIPPVNLSVVAGGSATFSLMITGHPPPFGYQLRKGSSLLTSSVSDEPVGFLTLPRVQATDAGTYRIVVTNAANPAPGLRLDPVTLTVLPDADQDGLPDDWELAHGLDPNDPSDAALDPDHDGRTNLEEYLTGTDPFDAQSFLRLERITASSGHEAVVIQFMAVSNVTYSLQSRDLASGEIWQRESDVVAGPTNRLVSFTNRTTGAASRFYRLASPASR